jgi:hypothetical protein
MTSSDFQLQGTMMEATLQPGNATTPAIRKTYLLNARSLWHEFDNGICIREVFNGDSVALECCRMDPDNPRLISSIDSKMYFESRFGQPHKIYASWYSSSSNSDLSDLRRHVKGLECLSIVMNEIVGTVPTSFGYGIQARYNSKVEKYPY